MEIIYRLKPTYRWITQISVVIFPICFVLFTGVAILIIRHLATGKAADGLYVWMLLVLSLGYIVSCVRTFIAVKRIVGFTVTLSNESVCVGNKTINWDEIESLEHPKRAYGIAFRINARDGRQLDVYSGIENAKQLEDTILSKLI
jgi:hypothetical protein